MISNGVEKIAVRSLNETTFVEDMPLNWREAQINAVLRRVKKKFFRIINREHLLNQFPEE